MISPASHDRRGLCRVSACYTLLQASDVENLLPKAIQPQHEITSLLRLIPKRGVVVPKIAILAIREGDSSGRPGFRGFPVLHGKVILSDMKSNILPNPPYSLGFKGWKYSF